MWLLHVYISLQGVVTVRHWSQSMRKWLQHSGMRNRWVSMYCAGPLYSLLSQQNWSGNGRHFLCSPTHTHTHTHTCACTHTHTLTHTCAHIHTCVHTHTHMCSHTHTHTHTHTYTHTLAHTLRWMLMDTEIWDPSKYRICSNIGAAKN